MCIRFGRECPGLEDGPLIVDMTEKARHGMQKRKSTSSSKPDVISESCDPVDQTFIDHISQQAAITEAFYACFLSYFTSKGEGKDIRNQLSWLHKLPQFSVDGTNDALTLAVQATASSYCAIDTRNPALTRHAWDLYGRAIQTHSRYVARSKVGVGAVTVHMISTTVLFSFFEAMQATSASAYRAHIYGAAKMFEVTNPKQCTQGILCQIFFHIRTQMAFVQLTNGGEGTPVDVRRILYGALDYEELPVFQRLTTQFTRLIDIYSETQALRGLTQEQCLTDLEECVTVADAIDELWREYTATALIDCETLSWHDVSTNTMCYRDAFTALTIAYFSATRILLAVIAPIQTNNEHTVCYESVLQASRFMDTRLIGCAYMRMAAPLLLVALHAPSTVQRQKATGYFESWKTGSMRGISALALARIRPSLPVLV